MSRDPVPLRITVDQSLLKLYYVSITRLKGLSHEIDFKNFDQTLKNLTQVRDAAGV